MWCGSFILHYKNELTNLLEHNFPDYIKNFSPEPLNLKRLFEGSEDIRSTNT